MRWTKIDGLIRADHKNLQPKDECFCFCEYTPRHQWRGKNKLVYDLNIPMTKKDTWVWPKKDRAIKACVVILESEMRKWMQLPGAVFVPVPPSKTKSHAEYDDRMLQILRMASARGSLNADIREIVRQRKDMTPSHLGGTRNIGKLIQNYEINESCAKPPPKLAIIVDDLVTTGAHFKAMQSVLIKRFGQIKTLGLFVGRRIR